MLLLAGRDGPLKRLAGYRGYLQVGTRQSEKASLWVATAELPKSPGHQFYTRLNALLEADTSIGSSKANAPGSTHR
jgi:hypothetical protein